MSKQEGKLQAATRHPIAWQTPAFYDQAIADEDLDRENDEKTSAVHFVRFEFSKIARDAVRAGAAVKLGCDPKNYPAHVAIAAETLAGLAGDLRQPVAKRRLAGRFAAA